ncbi:transglutaminase domain-containing protein [Palaeococcus ferrophilus]|uniref:transglutaminase domain-containing protein n=1 Tax=Palaeococcus ferrophilus TaxID=83868 RepID=UPI00064EE19D|nr:transglutaminase domain-containing protein [Palaeococcus ferrophilus]
MMAMRRYLSSVLTLALSLILILSLTSFSKAFLKESLEEGRPQSIEELLLNREPPEGLNEFLRGMNMTPPGGGNATPNTPKMKTPNEVDVRQNLYSLLGSEARPVMVVSGAAHTNYLRQNVYTTYENGVWKGAPEDFSHTTPELPEVADWVDATTVRDEITVKPVEPIEGNLFTALYTTDVSTEALYSPSSNLFRAINEVPEYSFTTVHYIPSKGATFSLRSPPMEEYLQVPEVSERVREFAKSLVNDGMSDYEKAEAIENYLRNNYVYDLRAPPAPEDVDPLEWFLFHSKRGVCLDFNSAFVILARLNGLSARLVTGFYIDATPYEQVVKLNQAHAWAEVYFEGLGWVVFDATGVPEERVRVRERAVEESIITAEQLRGMMPQPYRLIVEPNPLHLKVGEEGKVNVTLIREDSTVQADFLVSFSPPYGDALILHGTNVTESTRIGAFDSPGNYTSVVTASLGGNTLTTETLRIIVEEERFSITATPSNVTTTRGRWVEVRLRVIPSGGFRRVVTLKPSLPFNWSLSRKAGVPPFESTLKFYVPEDAEPGSYVISIVGNGGGKTYTLQVPVRVVAPTRVEITDFQSEARLGEWMWVKFRLTDDFGRPLPYGSAGVDGIYLTLNRTKEEEGVPLPRKGLSYWEKGEVEMEVFIPAELDVGEYHIVLHYPGNGYYLPSNSDPVVKIKAESEFEVETFNLTRAGEVRILGTLKEKYGKGIKGSVSLFLDGNLQEFIETHENGTFEGRVTVSPGEHTVRLEYGGDEYHDATSAEWSFRAVDVIVNAPETWEVGEKVRITGKVLGVEEGMVFLSSAFESFNATLKDGNFTFKVNTTKPGGYTLILSYETLPLWEGKVKVVSPTKLEVEAPKIKAGGEENVTVKLTDAMGNPLPGRTVEVTIDRTYKATTDANGSVVITVKGIRRGTYDGVAVFRGEEYYMPSEVAFELRVYSYLDYLPYILSALLVPAALIAYRRRDELEKLVMEFLPEPLRIAFDREPPVYGVGDGIKVSLEEEAELYVDGELIGRGREFTLSLIKGTHVVEAVGRKRGKARVHVVDYREEVIRLYGKLLKKAEEMGINTEDRTPEEVRRFFEEKGYDPGALKELTWLFEVARYSIYPFGWEDFLRFYRALSEVVGDPYGEED